MRKAPAPNALARSLMDGVQDPLTLTDSLLTVIEWNAAMESLTGVRRADALGRSATTVLPFLVPAGLGQSVRRCVTGEPVAPEEIPFSIPERDRHGWMETRYVPWRGDNGLIAGALIFLRDVTERRQRALFVSAIDAVGHSLTSSLDLEQVLDTIVRKALEVMGADSALAVSWDGVAPHFRVMRAAGRLSEEYAAAGTIPVSGGPISRAVLEARSVATSNILDDPDTWLLPERRRDIEREGFRAVAAAPLISKGRVHGALVVHFWSERVFGEDEQAALRLLAEHAALAIDNARLYTDATRRAARLRELAEVEQLVTESLEVDDVLERIAEATARLLEAPVVQVWTADTTARVLRLRAWSAGSGAVNARMPSTIAFGEGIAGRVAEQRSPIYVADVREDARVLPGAGADPTIARMLTVPILSGDEILGVLTVRSPADSLADEENQSLVISFAAQAAAALRNARAYADAVRRAARLRELVAVSQSITASLETADVITRIAESAADMARGAMTAVHLYDAERKRLRATATAGGDWTGLPLDRSADQGLPGLVLEERAPVLVARPTEHPRTLVPDWWSQRPGATYYGVPIVAGDILLGVLDYIQPDGVPDAEAQEALRLLATHAGVAIRNASLFQGERVQADRVRALTGVNQRISRTLDLDELLTAISESAAQLAGVRFSSFWLADEARRTLSFRGGSVKEISEDFPQRVVSYDAGAVGWIARHREALAIDDVFADERVLNTDWWARWGLRAYRGYPVMAGNELLAILSLSHSEPMHFGVDARDVIEMFLAQAAIAIQNARVYREAQRRREVAEVLARLGRELTASLAVDRIADLVAKGVVEIMDALGAAVYRYDSINGTLRVIAAHGHQAEAVRGLTLGPGEGIAGRAVAERKVVATADVLSEAGLELSEQVRECIAASPYRAAASVPLFTHERVIGALAVGAGPGHEFSAEELQTLQAIADQAALAFENARLFAAAQDSLARLRDTQAQLVQAAKLSALGQLVSGVAHELNNPLSVIIGYGQLLLTRSIPEAVLRPIDLMVAQADRMAKIVRNLLFFARQRPPERTSVILNQVIDQTLSLRLNQLTLNDIKVEREYLDDLPAIAGDSQQLEQVMLNLVLNAEQAILETKRGGTIIIRTGVRPGEMGQIVFVDVVDNGPGIAPDALAHVFEPFFTTKTVGTGTGLGLSVSYGIVEEHRGRLSVESRPGHTVFTLELPVARAGETQAAPTPVAPPVPGDGRVALIVEDEPTVLDLIVTLLGHTGWKVDVARGGRVGLERVRRKRYDLIVSDVRMPEGSGEEFYRGALLEDPTLSRRFMFITGDTANPTAWSFLKETGAPIIEKPFQPALFLDAVRRVTTALTPPDRRA